MTAKNIFSQVLEELLHSSHNTRGEIATSIGVSAMSVGKSINWLLDAGIICQRFDEPIGQGRRTGRLYFGDSARFAILDLATRHLGFFVFDTNIKLERALTFDYDDSFSYEDNLSIFLNNIRRSLGGEHGFSDYCLGIVLANEYTDSRRISRAVCPPQIKEDAIEALVCERLSAEQTKSFYSDGATLYSLQNSKYFRSSDRLLYIGISDSIDVFLLEKGVLEREIDLALCQFGEKSIGELLREKDMPLSLREWIAPILAMTVCMLAPEKIFVDSEALSFYEDITEEVQRLIYPETLHTKLDFLSARPAQRVVGAALELRDRYIYSKIERVIKNREKHRNKTNGASI